MAEGRVQIDYGIDRLLLIPTPFELNLLQRHWQVESNQTIEFHSDSARQRIRCRIAICGFGLVVSGIRTMSLIREWRPRQVVLCGIAGSYRQELEIGKAYLFDEVVCDGLGVGEGAGFCSIGTIGWRQWEGDSESSPIVDRIRLVKSSAKREGGCSKQEGHLLVSVAAASADLDQAKNRINRFPNAAAEDMEGFSVAAACELMQTPLALVRGISNLAGERDKSHWKCAEAMRSAAELVQQLLAIRCRD
jgi:futalosine hydrolase